MSLKQCRCQNEAQNKGKKGSPISTHFTLFTHFLNKPLYIHRHAKKLTFTYITF